MKIVTCFNFAEAFCFVTGWPGASGDLGKLHGIQLLSMWVTMISALITFSIQKLRLLLNRWAPSRKMVLCSSQ